MVILLNAFSLNMVSAGCEGIAVAFDLITADEARHAIVYARESGGKPPITYIRHDDTRAIVLRELQTGALLISKDFEIDPFYMNDRERVIIIAQYRGPRLPPGTTELPEGAVIEYWRARVVGGAWQTPAQRVG